MKQKVIRGRKAKRKVKRIKEIVLIKQNKKLLMKQKRAKNYKKRKKKLMKYKIQ